MKRYNFHLLVLLGLILLNLALFSLNLNDFFLSDDFDWLNLTKTSQHSVFDYFSANYYGERGVGGSYRPMVNVVFRLNYLLGGLNPLPYHLTNLVFHVGVCFLVYLLVLLLFDVLAEKKQLAILAAVFFAILPNHSEAVIWVAAVADPLATFFYLLAFYLYLLWRKKEKMYFLLISLWCFVISLLTKEMAITLPLLIVVWELYEALTQKKFTVKNIILKSIGYWLIVIGYFGVRYSAIGLVWGYYARETFKIDWLAIYTMFVSLLTNLLFFGQMRVYLVDYFVANKLFFVLSLILVLSLIFLALKKYKFKSPFLVDAYLLLILPVLLLNYNHFTDEGERYNFLPSVVFCILLVLLILQIKKNIWKKIVMSALLLYFVLNLANKNYNWQLAANLTQQIIFNDFPQAVDLAKKDEKVFLVALPDNLSGVPVLRNGFKEAIGLYYPDYHWQATLLNAYVRLERSMINQKVLYWGPYPTGGYIAQTFDQRNWVTGFDRRETADYIFELWGYDYATYSSKTLRLILKNEQGGFLKAGEEKDPILIFDQGHLKPLNKKPFPIL